MSDHNNCVENSCIKRLHAAEERLAEIERLLRAVRKRLADAAEDVRIAAHAAARARKARSKRPGAKRG